MNKLSTGGYLIFFTVFSFSAYSIDQFKSKVGLANQIYYSCIGNEIDSVNTFGSNETLSKNIYNNIKLFINLDLTNNYIELDGNKNFARSFKIGKSALERDDNKYFFQDYEHKFFTIKIFKKTNEISILVGNANDNKTKTSYYEYQGHCDIK